MAIFIVITSDPELAAAAQRGFHPDDECRIVGDWRLGLDQCSDADLIFVDLISTLVEPHKISGYEAFAAAKMAHKTVATVPLVLISPPAGYELDFMAGYPNFVLANVQRPVDYKVFRRASTWV
ncbi:MAG: hypothetical protein ACOYON_04500 [Fimbriimonas sp.]